MQVSFGGIKNQESLIFNDNENNYKSIYLDLKINNKGSKDLDTYKKLLKKHLKTDNLTNKIELSLEIPKNKNLTKKDIFIIFNNEQLMVAKKNKDIFQVLNNFLMKNLKDLNEKIAKETVLFENYVTEYNINKSINKLEDINYTKRVVKQTQILIEKALKYLA